MAIIGNISTINVNGNDLTIKDAALTEIVNEIIEAIGANNGDISERINNLHGRSFDALIKISSQNESEISNIQDGMYKLQYVTVTGEGDNTTETLNNSAILIQKGTNQYLYKDGQLSSRIKTDSTWGNWITFEGGVTSVNGMTGAVITQLSDDYAPSSEVNENLELTAGDTYEEAFGKLHKAILDNEQVVAGTLADFDERLDTVEDDISNLATVATSGDYDDLTGKPTIPENVSDLNNDLGFITNAGVTSVNGQTGAVSLPLGDKNIIETVKVNGAALTPDVNKAVNITVPTKITTDSDTTYIEGNPAVVIHDGNHDNWVESGRIEIEPSGSINIISLDDLDLIVPTGKKVTYNAKEIAVKDDIKVTSVNGQIGAVTVKENVQSDWNATTGDAVILNKPDLSVYENKVTSVNGMTGAVTINVPTKTSELTNDSNFTTLSAVQTEIVGAAPEQLNTLSELAAALNDDANFASTVTTLISEKYTKPSTGIPASDLANGVIAQSDWNQTDTTANDYIKNKPNIVIENNTYLKLSSPTSYTSYNPYIAFNGGGINFNNIFGPDNYSYIQQSSINMPHILTSSGDLILYDMYGPNNTDSSYISINIQDGLKYINTYLNPNVNFTVNNGGAYYNTKKLATEDKIPTLTSQLSNDSGFITEAPVTSVNGATGAVTVKENVQSDWNATSGDAVILNKPTIPTVNDSTVTLTMNGNTVGTFTLNKSGNTTIDLGTVLTSHQSIKTVNNESLVGTGNVSIQGLPTVTSVDNGKVLMVVDGAWQLVSPVSLYSGSGTPDNTQGNNGDIYIQS